MDKENIAKQPGILPAPPKKRPKKRGPGGPPKDPRQKYKLLQVTVPPGQFLRLRAYAVDQNKPISVVVQEALSKLGVAA